MATMASTPTVARDHARADEGRRRVDLDGARRRDRGVVSKATRETDDAVFWNSSRRCTPQRSDEASS
jgi:hypothetical protein